MLTLRATVKSYESYLYHDILMPLLLYVVRFAACTLAAEAGADQRRQRHTNYDSQMPIWLISRLETSLAF